MIKLFRYLKKYAWMIVVTIVLIFAQCMADLTLPDLMSDIINNGVLKEDVPYIWQIGWQMLLVALGSMVAAVTAGYLASRIGTGYARDLRSMVFNKVEGFSIAQFDSFSTASLITRSTNDIQQMGIFVVMMLRIMVSAPITMIGGIIKGSAKSTKLTWILAVSIPVILIIVTVVIKLTTKYFKQMQERLDKMNLVLREGLTGVRVIRAFGRDDRQTERFEKANVELTDVSLKAQRVMGVMMPLMMLIMNMTQLGIVWFAGPLIDSGEMDLGGMMAFIQYAIQILFSFLMFGFIFMMLPRAAASGARIWEVLASENTLHDPETPVSPEKTGGVVFDNVTFAYPGAEQPTLSGISFTAKRGETVAIIGGTGSGKSTIGGLLMRFFDVSGGQVLVDGTDVREMTQADLHSRIGFVPQTAKLVTGTIMDNIKFGNPDVTDEQAAAAAKTAQAEEFISGREDGMNAEITQSGTNLSGGQKQRISIARAIAKKPEIFIFDDSFSALDFKTDAMLREALKKDTGDATIIVIAQRINTIMNADRILVLNEGQIAGIGTHEELMKSCDIYREIASSQLAKEVG
ncbi:MAG TPA: ABC transporter ATP-binding protein [Oscillospiraceae bacterium]|nr:ABC transporter ATP-binding protein [Oscillospiraceae bacterium]HPF56254.1 ABC transporter ATP-binding protein [Clostridiales bacterium]HPK34500.1 ABC transporter ATP-binding protein [Oscillospiraceae bacterium]HPR74728.1 ABC transporter ATP-binding protein [Oscillospiraceae bacterium]